MAGVVAAAEGEEGRAQQIANSDGIAAEDQGIGHGLRADEEEVEDIPLQLISVSQACGGADSGSEGPEGGGEKLVVDQERADCGKDHASEDVAALHGEEAVEEEAVDFGGGIRSEEGLHGL